MADHVLPSHSDDLNAEKHEKIVPANGNLVARNHITAVLGEFIGTAMFIMFSLGSTSVALQAATTVNGSVKDGSSTANASNLLYIAFSFGASLSVAVFCFFRVSGGLFNPAVTLAIALLGGITPLRAVLLFITQIAGALAGAAIADALSPGPLLAQATLGGGASVARGFFIEFFMAATLVFTIIMLAVEKNRGTFMAPLGIGMALFICELFSVYYTGGALNPARAFAPAWLATSPTTTGSTGSLLSVGPFSPLASTSSSSSLATRPTLALTPTETDSPTTTTTTSARVSTALRPSSRSAATLLSKLVAPHITTYHSSYSAQLH